MVLLLERRSRVPDARELGEKLAAEAKATGRLEIDKEKRKEAEATRAKLLAEIERFLEQEAKNLASKLTEPFMATTREHPFGHGNRKDVTAKDEVAWTCGVPGCAELNRMFCRTYAKHSSKAQHKYAHNAQFCLNVLSKEAEEKKIAKEKEAYEKRQAAEGSVKKSKLKGMKSNLTAMVETRVVPKGEAPMWKCRRPECEELKRKGYQIFKSDGHPGYGVKYAHQQRLCVSHVSDEEERAELGALRKRCAEEFGIKV